MTLEQFEQQLGDLGENLTNMQTILTEIAGRIVDQMKDSAPTNSHALRNSIRAIVTENELQIAMLNYGVFQNYGVDGMSRSVANEVPEFGITPQPRTGRRFGFSGDYEMIGGDLPFAVRKSIYQLGIRPQPFFDITDMADVITEYVATRIIENN